MDENSWKKYEPFFKPVEFDSPDAPGSSYYMQESFMDKLLEARNQSVIPFIITSGYRTKAHNRKVGGVPNSSHLKGFACDIAFKSTQEAFHLMMVLCFADLTRIGLGKNFIHVDSDPDKKPHSFWIY